MSAESKEDQSLWNFVQVDEYAVPSFTVSVGKVRSGIREFFRRLGGKNRRSESPLRPDDNLSDLSGPRLERALPKPDLTEGGRLLVSRLKPWLESGLSSKPVIFYIAAPFTGRTELLKSCSDLLGAPLVALPDRENILGKHQEWFSAWPEGDLWILPDLEKCFLRRADGLDLVRELLSRVLSGELGRGIIGCDGWAWSFLQQVWLGRPSFTITAQALDEVAMNRYFSRCLRASDGELPFSFRQADNGAYLFEDTREPVGKKSRSRSTAGSFWLLMAEYSRGNPGVATACWQRALSSLPEKALEDESGDSRRALEQTIWVKPWETLELPHYPEDEGETALFVLHALLIHNGLDADSLAYMLPADRAEIIEVLLFLRDSELVEEIKHESGSIWRVSAIGYPVVRKKLQANGYLCDPF